MFKLDTCCTLVPYFEVQEGQLSTFRALGPKFVAKSRTESGCIHYAFSFNGNVAHCREGYDSAEALLAHTEHWRASGGGPQDRKGHQARSTRTRIGD